MALVATVLTLIASHGAPAAGTHGCATHPDCLQRVARHQRYAVRKAHRRHWRRVTRPFRAWLRSTRQCESGGNYRIDTGNGFYGAYQFTLTSWQAVGGHGLPNLAEPLEQDYRAVLLLHVQGRGAWPVCG